jgi:3-hydroxybutyryl-CoA dehydrogenase
LMIERRKRNDVSAQQQVAVVGAGTMGSGIAQVSALAGCEVTMRDINEESLERGLAAIRSSLSRFASKGRIAEADVDAALGRITPTTDLDALGQADIIVEAVFENLDIKRELFAAIDKIAKPGAILASNTSAIPITAIAAATERPEAVVGAHFFSPVPMMALCELVRGIKTSDDTLARTRAYAEQIGKTCIVVNRDVAGFVTTRLITALTNEAIKLLENGVATAEDIDIACKLGFGHAQGPLATADGTGVDIMLHATNNIYQDTKDTKFAPPELLQRMVAAGLLGRKSGEGFYQH